MKKAFIILSIVLLSFTSKASIHIVHVWDGYFKFLDANITIQLGDTVQWLPLDVPMMVHTITSTNIPTGAVAFDQIWQAPADTFFQYVPQIAGLYEYQCTPHAISYNMVGSINVIDGAANIDGSDQTEINPIIYPNPTSNVVYIDKLYSKSKYNIYNHRGELIMAGKVDKTINLSTLKHGNYIIEIFGDRARTIKILKQ